MVPGLHATNIAMYLEIIFRNKLQATYTARKDLNAIWTVPSLNAAVSVKTWLVAPAH